MSKLWKKNNTQSHPAVNKYIISKNLEADNILFPYDIKASIAHAEMLYSVGLLEEEEKKSLIFKLKSLGSLHKKGDFKLEQKNEDMHTAIENYLTEKLGDIGKKIHTGRSRNDQVLVAMRLFTKEGIKETQELLKILAKTILSFAKKYEFIPMAGYTHTQRAMPSSVGQWASSFAESLIDDFYILQSAFNLNDQNPLGSAAGFGTSLPINRELTTKKLEFSKTQINPIYCQNSRGKIESFTITSLLQVMETLGKIANDLIWFTSKEFNFFSVNLSLTTGSSIMPQKRNLDIMEVLRANVSIIQSLQIQTQTVSKNLISGYNKDLKITKKTLIDSILLAQESIEIVDLLFKNLKPNIENLEKSLDKEVFATDEVNRLVQEGMPFREAYIEVGNNLDQLARVNIFKTIESRKHLGATGNLGLKMLEKTLEQLK
jgi:argininosuccinate lyase